MELTKSAQSTALRLQIELTKSVTYIYDKATLTWFEEIFEEYKTIYHGTYILYLTGYRTSLINFDK